LKIPRQLYITLLLDRPASGAMLKAGYSVLESSDEQNSRYFGAFILQVVVIDLGVGGHDSSYSNTL
jgi:hypothetical protein